MGAADGETGAPAGARAEPRDRAFQEQLGDCGAWRWGTPGGAWVTQQTRVPLWDTPALPRALPSSKGDGGTRGSGVQEGPQTQRPLGRGEGKARSAASKRWL